MAQTVTTISIIPSALYPETKLENVTPNSSARLGFRHQFTFRCDPWFHIAGQQTNRWMDSDASASVIGIGKSWTYGVLAGRRLREFYRIATFVLVPMIVYRRDL